MSDSPNEKRHAERLADIQEKQVVIRVFSSLSNKDREALEALFPGVTGEMKKLGWQDASD